MSIFFGGVDDEAEVWLNGEKVGEHSGHSDPFYFDISNFLSKGDNELVVRVKDFGGPGGIYRPVVIVPQEQIELLLRSKYAEMNARESAEWVKDAIIYEVYLRSFSKDGSFKSLQRRLPEIKELGVNVIWLMPIHPVGELNRKGTLGSPYSVQDFYSVNPEFGTLDDFKSLVNSIHENGMKIIIDLVANHTAWDNKLIFEQPEWFTINNEGTILAPNSDCTDVADLNYEKYELRKYMIAMMKYWVKKIGIDGFRCDVSELVPTEFWERARRELDDIKSVLMLSEGTIPEHHVSAFDITYSWNIYDVLQNVVEGKKSVKIFDELLKRESMSFPKGSLRLRFNTNHDKNFFYGPSIIKYGKNGAKATAVLTYTFPGIPLLYNGDEVGNDKYLSLFEKVEIDWSKNPEFRDFYNKLGALHTTHKALSLGDFKRIKCSDEERVYTFERKYGEDHVIVVINFDKKTKEAKLSDLTFKDGSLFEYFSGERFTVVDGEFQAILESYGYYVFIRK